MEIPKQMVVERLRERGDFDLTRRAEAELPDKLDTERDAALLSEFGIDPGSLSDQFGGQAPAAT